MKSVWQIFAPRQKKLGDFSKTLQAQCPNIDQIAWPSSHNIFLSLILDTIDSKCNTDRLQLWLVFALYMPTNFIITKKILKFLRENDRTSFFPSATTANCLNIVLKKQGYRRNTFEKMKKILAEFLKTTIFLPVWSLYRQYKPLKLLHKWKAFMGSCQKALLFLWDSGQ